MRGKNKAVLMLFMLILVAALITGCEKETAANRKAMLQNNVR